MSIQAKNNASILGGLLHASGYTVHVNPVIAFTHPAIQLWLHQPIVPVLKTGTICNYVLNQKPGFEITHAYAEKIADKILTNDRARVPVLGSQGSSLFSGIYWKMSRSPPLRIEDDNH